MTTLLDDSNNLGEKPPRPLGLYSILCGPLMGNNIAGGFVGFWLLMVPMYVFGVNSELIHLKSFFGTWIETSGFFIEVSKTEAGTDDDSSTDDKPIFKYDFSFELNGQQIERSSYSTDLKGWEPGQEVLVEYNVENPSVAKIKGMTLELFDLKIGLSILFAVLCLVVYVINSICINYNYLYLLKNGILVNATLIDTKPADALINYATYTFKFEVEGKGYLIDDFRKTSEATASEIVLYDSNKISSHKLLSKMSGPMPIMDQFGDVKALNASHLYVWIAPIGGFLFFVAYYFYFKNLM